MSARHPQLVWPAEDLTVAWQSASLLLDYPDERRLEDLPVLRAAAAALPRELGAPLAPLVEHLATTPLPALQEAYVETFDSRRRCNLFLTYFAHGDTRKRGIALLRFKQTYLRSGYLLEEHGGELPDHLCVVLEYAATVDQRLGWGLLLDHRAGIELLRLSLTDSGSPWAGALVSLCATLPPLRGDEREAVQRLAAEGPPAEEVGLTPYGTPAFDPALHRALPLVEPVETPTPVLRGAR
ncbi:MAG TPA: nitrate reductase molybdenum cofactor assembly chaperone [Nocardioides sp.]|nr:nitrate reductase molybdenum cofactor assembly chaperone [Nocardioides sp.]